MIRKFWKNLMYVLTPEGGVVEPVAPTAGMNEQMAHHYKRQARQQAHRARVEAALTHANHAYTRAEKIVEDRKETLDQERRQTRIKQLQTLRHYKASSPAESTELDELLGESKPSSAKDERIKYLEQQRATEGLTYGETNEYEELTDTEDYEFDPFPEAQPEPAPEPLLLSEEEELSQIEALVLAPNPKHYGRF